MTTDADRLAASPFLQALDAEQRAVLVANGTALHLQSGERLFAEGEQGDALFIVRQGEVAITLGQGRQAIRLDTIGPGGIVGEIALLSPGPRTATATASSDLDLLRIGRDQLEQVLLDHPRAAIALLDILGARLRATDARPAQTGGAIPRWPALIAMLVLGLVYLLLPDRYTVGPRWTVLVAILVLIVPLVGSRRLGYHRVTHILALGVPLVLTLAVASSAGLLLIQLPSGSGATEPLTLLREAGLIWVANITTFALWYWQLDGGGPTVRQPGRHASTDFLFPQQQEDDDGVVEGWSPGFFDYLVLAFNTATAFSPTDTLVLSRRMKGLMMAQALISLIVVGVLIARAINTLGGQ